MMDRQLLEAINRKLEALDGLMDSVSDQLMHLVRHVEEVRQTNSRLKASMQKMAHDNRAPETTIETSTDFLAGKIDHFVKYFSMEHARERTRFDSESYLLSRAQGKTEERLDAIERRLDHLEASSVRNRIGEFDRREP